jgi:ribonuclease D
MQTLFEIKLNINIYKVYVVNNTNLVENKKGFLNELTKINDKINDKIKICLDYEFNNNKIGLVQVMISNKNISNNIYLFNPLDFNQVELELIKEAIYLSPYPKILHGSEGLDIPYIYNNVLNNNSSEIKQFTRHLTDTRFKCELLNHKRCSLYDILYETKSINDKQNKILLDNYKKNGKIYKINWNTRNMTLEQYMYAAFDVIFLRRLDRILNKQLGLQQKKLLNEYIRFVFLFRNKYINFEDNNLISMLKLSEDEIKELVEINKNNVGLKIQYFKKPIIQLTRFYLYDSDNKNKINLMLDNYGLKLIKNDLQNISWNK